MDIDLKKFSEADKRLIREGAEKMNMTVAQYIEVVLKAAIYRSTEKAVGESVHNPELQPT